MPFPTKGSGSGTPGPQGDPGPQGVQGIQGIQGPQGLQGPAGTGVDPTDVGYDIVLCAGQSNMEGNPAWDALIDGERDSRIFQFGGSSADSASYRKIIAGVDPMYMYNGARTGLTGPATYFGRAYGAAIPSNRKVLLIPVAAGSTALIGGLWAPGNPGGTLFELSITQANLAIAAALLQYPNSRFVGTIWAQGEADAVAGQTQAAYVAGLKSVISGFRSRITGATNSWFVISGMVPEYIAANSAQYTPIDLAHKQVVSETAKTAFVTGPTGYGNGVHYTAPGIRIQGARLGLAVPTAIANAGVDTTPPTSASAAVANGTPTTVTVTASEALNTSFAPAASAFTVSGHTVSAVAVQGLTYTLTVDTFVNGEAARTVSYTQPGANQLRDVAGNLMASFSGLAVTNNVLPVDVTAPTLSSPTGAGTGTTTASGSVTTDEANGTLYALISANATETATTVKASGTTQAISSTGVKSVSATGLTASTTYYWHFLHRDAAGNDSTVSNSASFTTSASATVAGAPTIGTATAGSGSATVAFTAPGSNGGSAITSYTATSSPGGFTGTLAQAGSGVITVNGLTNGTAYTFTVTATNGVGTSAASAASNSVTPAAASFATWNPADIGATIVLSNGNLTMTKNGSSAYVSGRSTVSKSAGKWYWENTIQVQSSWMCGVGKAGAGLNNYVGSDAFGWGYFSTSGNKFSGGTSVAFGATYAIGDIIGVALDMDAGTVTFYKNGVSQGIAFTGLTGPMFAMSTVNGGVPAGAITTNFGASAFAYTPPAGHVGLA